MTRRCCCRRHQCVRWPSTWQQLALDKVRSPSTAAQHGASRGCRHRHVEAAASAITSANARADHACGSRLQHAAECCNRHELATTNEVAHGKLAGIDGAGAADTAGAGNTLLHLRASPACAGEGSSTGQHRTACRLRLLPRARRRTPSCSIDVALLLQRASPASAPVCSGELVGGSSSLLLSLAAPRHQPAHG